MEEGQNDSGQQPLRDCSCRGGSGFSHLSCLVEYAGYKCQQINDVSQFSNLWEVCPSCNQNYQNELAVNLATKFVDFVENTYADDQSRYLEALLFKLTTLHNNMGGEKKLEEDTKQLARNMLSIIGQMKTVESSQSKHYRILFVEGDIHLCLGGIGLSDGTDEGLKTAILHLEKFRSICCGFTGGIKAEEKALASSFAETFIAHAKSKLHGKKSSSTVEGFQRWYNDALKKTVKWLLAQLNALGT